MSHVSVNSSAGPSRSSSVGVGLLGAAAGLARAGASGLSLAVAVGALAVGTLA